MNLNRLTTEEQRANIQQLITVIRGLPDEQCDMGRWILSLNLQLPRRAERGKPGCGTVGCMAGLAVVNLMPCWLSPLTALTNFFTLDELPAADVTRALGGHVEFAGGLTGADTERAFIQVKARQVDMVTVPREWADNNSVHYDSDDMTEPTAFEAEDGTMEILPAVQVMVPDAAKALLGHELDRMFYLMDAPNNEGMSDKDWMLMVLDYALRGRVREYFDDYHD